MQKLFANSAAVHSEPRIAPHCRVLPPGYFNYMIHELLPVYCEIFMTTAVTVSR